MSKLLSCNVYNFVKTYKTSYEEGFSNVEIHIILNTFKNIDRTRFFDALTGITCTSKNEQILYYKHDIEKALLCGIEDRNLTEEEFD